ncbi:TPA: hypothetical protein ACHJUL_004688, partial [Escherichia coli]
IFWHNSKKIKRLLCNAEKHFLKYGGPFCGFTGIPAVAESEAILENHIMDTVLQQPAALK